MFKTSTPAADGTADVLMGSNNVYHHLNLKDNSPHDTCEKASVSDLIHLSGPLTEDNLIRCLHQRFVSRDFVTKIGMVLLSLNPYRSLGNPLTLSSVQMSAEHQPPSVLSNLRKVVNETIKQQTETGYPQAIILRYDDLC